jgi:hypothetical protein
MDCYEVLFIIYSCRKKLNLSEQLYDMVNGKLNNCKVFLMYGDESISEEFKIIDNKYLVLKVPDYYENLREKTIKMFSVVENTFPNVKGCFKCDDDMIPCVKSLNNYIEYFLKHDIHYAGKVSHVHESGQMSWHHVGKCHNSELHKNFNFIHGCTYVNGPLYYLNKDTIIKFNQSDKSIYMFSEDAMVGFHLNRENIFPINIDTYTDYFDFKDNISFQNINNNIKKIYVKIHGGIGNQLFQIASGYGISRKHNKILIIVNDNNPNTFNHNSSLNVYLENIFRDQFLMINEDKLDKIVATYSEINNIVDCFSYNDKIIENSKINNTEQDLFLYGYFQNEKYFRDYKHEIIKFFKNESIISELNKKYIHLNHSFFIHVRRGDYVGNNLYQIYTGKYYWKSYSYIKNDRNFINAHFYILSDDIEFCKQLNEFNKFGMRRTFIENETALNSLYIMTLCNFGGICSNSTFSWWGSYMNENPNKIVIFPDKWIENGRYGKENDVYYENSVLIDAR